MVNKHNSVKEDKVEAREDKEGLVAPEPFGVDQKLQQQSFSTDPRPEGGDKVIREGGEVKSEENKLARIVGKWSVCGGCQQSFSGEVAPVEKSKEKFEGEELFSAVHPQCKDKPVAIYVLVRKQEKDKPTLVESKQIIEIPAKYIDSVKEKQEKEQK